MYSMCVSIYMCVCGVIFKIFKLARIDYNNIFFKVLLGTVEAQIWFNLNLGSQLICIMG